MVRTIEIEISSLLTASRDEVWDVVATMDGVNAELGPFVRMTHPKDLPSLADVAIRPGEVVFTSWLLLFRVLPFDRHSLRLEHLEAGHGFVEDSTSWLQRRWRHERTLADSAGGGCLVTDRLVIVPRIGLGRPLVGLVARRLFAHRHRQLRRRFGGA